MSGDIMCEPNHPLRGVAWSELFPWLMLFRALRLSTSLPLLLTATVAVLLLPLGWRFAAMLFGEPAGVEMVAVPASYFPPLNWQAAAEPAGFAPPEWVVPLSWRAFFAPMMQVLPGGVPPVRELFRIGTTWNHFGYVAIGTLWNVLVWGFFGAVIVRSAVMQLGRDERVGLFDAAQFAARRYASYVGAPFFPLAGTVVIVLCSIPVGWLLRFDAGLLLASLIWFLVLLGGFLAAVILVGLLLGWPLMWAALSAEEMGDVFEATQRSYSYTFGRPLHYACYAALALLIGSGAFLVAQWLAAWVVYLSLWTVSWGAGTESLRGLADTSSWTRLAGVALISWWSQLPFTVASAFRYAFFWCAAGAIYLLLRRDSDQIDFDVVHVPGQQPPHALPPLSVDAAGVPGMPDVPEHVAGTSADRPAPADPGASGGA